MARPNRPSPLPSAQESRVTDPTLQRVLDGILSPLRAVVEFLQPFVQAEAWKKPVWGAGWRDYSTVLNTYQTTAYRKNPLGRVELRGLVERASGVGTTIFTLPEGYRPTKTRIFVSLGSTGVGRIDITSGGVVTYISGGVTFFTLEGITFDTVN